MPVERTLFFPLFFSSSPFLEFYFSFFFFFFLLRVAVFVSSGSFLFLMHYVPLHTQGNRSDLAAFAAAQV